MVIEWGGPVQIWAIYPAHAGVKVQYVLAHRAGTEIRNGAIVLVDRPDPSNPIKDYVRAVAPMATTLAVVLYADKAERLDDDVLLTFLDGAAPLAYRIPPGGPRE